VIASSNFGGELSNIEFGMPARDESCLTEKIITHIGHKYNKSPTQVVLRWGI